MTGSVLDAGFARAQGPAFFGIVAGSCACRPVSDPLLNAQNGVM